MKIESGLEATITLIAAKTSATHQSDIECQLAEFLAKRIVEYPSLSRSWVVASKSCMFCWRGKATPAWSFTFTSWLPVSDELFSTREALQNNVSQLMTELYAALPDLLRYQATFREQGMFDRPYSVTAIG